MKKRIYAMLLVVIMVFTVMLTACGGDKKTNEAGDDIVDRWADIPKGISLVIIVGNHANSNNLLADDRHANQIGDLLAKAYTKERDSDGYIAQNHIYVISCDGVPEKIPLVDIYTGEELIETEWEEDPYYLEGDIKNQVALILEFLQSEAVYADDREVDLLSALYEAKFILDRESGVEKHILIIDSGISTTGGFNMCVNDIQDSTIEEVINRIPEEKIPNFNKEVKVTFLGVGNASEPQTMPDDQKYKLADIWTEIIENENCCNATLTEPIKVYSGEGTAMRWNEDETGLPFVSCVFFKDKDINLKDDYTIEKRVFMCDELGFKPYSDDFVNEDNAIKAIRGVAGGYNDYLTANPDAKIYVVGSIARTDKDSKLVNSNEYSRKRANKVANILVKKFGLPKDRVIPIDAGETEFSWRNAEEFPNGEKNEYNQQLNRVVAIIPDCATDEMAELRSSGYVK